MNLLPKPKAKKSLFYRDEGGAVSVVVLIAAIGLIAFLVITNIFSFKDELFNLLYPKPPSHATTGVIKPTKLSIINAPPRDPATGALLTTQQVVSTFQNLVYVRGYVSYFNTYKSAGWTGTAMQYMILDDTAGPSNLYSVSAQSTPCTSTQQSFGLYSSDQIFIEKGDFCRVHDSIIEGKKTTPDPSKKVDINADGNPAGSDSDDVYATENWFIHNQDGSRKSHVGGATGGSLYRPNPANADFRKYFIARTIRELKGGKNVDGTNHSATGMDGIYLDNVDLSWGNITRTTINGCADSASCVPLEFSTSTAFADSVFSFVQQIHGDPGWKALTKPLWGNMTEGSDTGSDWDRYMPYLEGGLKENYILNWGNGPYSSTRQLNQITQAEKWVGAGKFYVAVGQGCNSTVTDSTNPLYCATGERDSEARYTLTSYLLVTDGINASFKIVDDTHYGPFFDYPEYYYQLGTPLGAKFQKTSSPLVYRRDFECGYVEVDMTNSVGTIVYTTGCTPGGTPPPSTTPSPSSISSATPPILPSPTPTLSPSDTTAPSVAITYPTNGSTVSRKSTVNIQASASDNVGVTKVEFYVNNSLKCTDTTLPYSCSWFVPGAKNASYTLKAKAYDPAGNNSSSTITVTAK